MATVALLPIQTVPFPPLSLSETIEGGFYSIATMLIGIAVIGYSYSRHKQRRLMQDTATSEVESMAVGAVELTGTVEKAEETIPGLLTDESCVIVDYDVEEYRWGDDGKEWITQDSGVLAEPFYLNDGTGRLLVDISDWTTDYEVSAANRTREEYEDTAAQPPVVDAFVDEYTDEAPDSEKQRRYTQKVLPVGAEAYVFGDAELADRVDCAIEPDDDAAELIVTEDADTELFLISDKDEEQLTEDRRFSLALGGIFGIVVFSVGLAWFLGVLGV